MNFCKREVSLGGKIVFSDPFTFGPVKSTQPCIQDKKKADSSGIVLVATSSYIAESNVTPTFKML